MRRAPLSFVTSMILVLGGRAWGQELLPSAPPSTAPAQGAPTREPPEAAPPLRAPPPVEHAAVAAESPREVVYVEEPRAGRPKDPESWHDGFSFGFEIDSFQQDFGFGGRLVSPNIAHFIRFSGSGGAAWFPNALERSQPKLAAWSPYYYGRLQLELTGPQLGLVRTYAFAGAILIGAPKQLSSTEVNMGGLGGFGFEFLIGRLTSYFVELGAIGTGATADQLVDSPTFANGFLISVGSRIYP